MTDAAWRRVEQPGRGDLRRVYFLALLAHLVEWSSLRGVEEPAAVAASPAAPARPAGSRCDGAGRPRAHGHGHVGRAAYRPVRPARPAAHRDRLAVQAVGLFARGMAADPNRVPWGNMYEFTLSGTFVVVLFYLLLRRRFGLDWMAPIVVGFVSRC